MVGNLKIYTMYDPFGLREMPQEEKPNKMDVAKAYVLERQIVKTLEKNGVDSVIVIGIISKLKKINNVVILKALTQKCPTHIINFFKNIR